MIGNQNDQSLLVDDADVDFSHAKWVCGEATDRQAEKVKLMGAKQRKKKSCNLFYVFF